MPKEVSLIKSFDSGLITQIDARDLESNSCALSDGLDFSISGKIKILGDGLKDVLTGDATNPLLDNPFIQQGEGLISFKYDYDLGEDIVGVWSANASGSGHLSPPKFRENGVTYFVCTYGEDKNEILIIAKYQDKDGNTVFTSVGPLDGTYNSSVNTSDHIYANSPLEQNWGYQQEPHMRVGPDSNADITGYWVNGGFRYCDANFDNINNNIVGYFGHVNRTYLSSLTKVRKPYDDITVNQYDDLSYSRNCWHFSTYTHPKTGSWSGGGWVDPNFTVGFPSFLSGCFTASYDGKTNWDNYTQAFPNHKIWLYCANNRDIKLTSSGTFGNEGDIAPSYENENGVRLYEDTMPDDHDLRRRWVFGISTLYDGDPKGLCQETSIQHFYTYKSTRTDYGDATPTTNYKIPNIYDFKHKRSTTEMGSGDATNGNERPGGGDIIGTDSVTHGLADSDELPKLNFTWQWFPWWADSKHYDATSWDSTYVEDPDKPFGNHLSYFRPPWDVRMTGFRIYMQEVDDTEKNWYNVATVDCLRGEIHYNGCSQEHAHWLPRGRPSSMDMTRLDNNHPNNGETASTTGVWTNDTTGFTQLSGTCHDGAKVSVANYDSMNTGGGAGNYVHPNIGNHVTDSVNIESIPDLTYEILNGYKDGFSPTMVYARRDGRFLPQIQPLISNAEDEEGNYLGEVTTNHDYSKIQKSWGNIFRFKTSTILNDRVYIGNIMNTTTKQIYPDRVLKTEPGQYDIFPDDGFHHIDIATDDGDSIVNIDTFAGKLFVWKRHVLFVIKISDTGDESIESTHYHYGINNKNQVVKTKHGLCWFNEGGLYLYDMEGKISNLTDNKIDIGKYMDNYFIANNDSGYTDFLYYSLETEYEDWGGPKDPHKLIDALMPENPDLYKTIQLSSPSPDTDWNHIVELIYTLYPSSLYDSGNTDNAWDILLKDIHINQIQFGWKGFIGSDGGGGKPKPVIGYQEISDKVIIYKNSTDSGMSSCSGDAYIYNFKNQNWSFGSNLFTSGTGIFKSNFVNDANGNLIYVTSDFTSDGSTVANLKQWDDIPTSKKNIMLMTKDLDFETPGVRKKVHKIYISMSGAPSELFLLYAINGSKKFSRANKFTGVQNYSEADGFQPPTTGEYQSHNNWYTAILKPTTNSEADSLKNIYSIQLLFVGANVVTNGQGQVENVPSSIQINDVSVIYRLKSAK